MFRRLGWSCLVVLAAWSCHDAPRENPLDPVLTPPVELTVALDGTAGTATLTWTPYRGDQPFAEYQVLRNVSRSTVVDTLARITVQGECAYLDTSLAPDTAYEYKVAVVNASGFEVASALQRVDGYTTRAVHLLPLKIEPDSGMVRLTWTQYRDPGFARYRVLRRQVGTDQEVELAVRLAPDDTTWTDSTARHQVDYAYTVAVEAAGQILRSGSRERRLELPPVVVQATFDSRTATATLAWTRYSGPRFQAYQVQRSAGASSTVVARIPGQDQSALVDSGLIGNTEYLYEVKVLTGAGEEITGAPAGGIIHRLVGTWPLDARSGVTSADEYVRLYTEPDGRVAMISFDSGKPTFIKGQVRLYHLGASGEPLEERELVDALLAWDNRGAAMAITPAGERVLAVTLCKGFVTEEPSGTLLLGAGEGLARPETQLFTGETLLLPDAVQGTMLDKASIWFDGYEQAGGINHLVIATGDKEYREDFGPREVYYTMNYLGFPGVPEYEFGGWLFGGWLALWHSPDLNTGPLDNRLTIGGLREVTTFRVETDFMLSNGMGRFGLELGGETHARLSLVVDTAANTAELVRGYEPPGGEGSPGLTDTLTAPLPFAVLTGLPYRLILGVDDGQVQAALQGWAVAGEALRSTTVYTWTALAPLGNLLAYTLDNEAYAVTLGEAPVPLDPFTSYVGELRARVVAGERRPRIAACLPLEDQVQWGRVLQPARWDVALRQQVIGPHLAGGSSLHYPLSCDLAPDGQLYVLDAGNQRIVVFDQNSRYVTQWGGSGSEGGRFDFGPGSVRTAGRAFAGSICVDDSGFIYVADPGNHRIQKFAP